MLSEHNREQLAALRRLIEKCKSDADNKNLFELEQRCNENIHGENGICGLVGHFLVAVRENEKEDIGVLAHTAKQLFAILDKNKLARWFAEQTSGINSWHLLLSALSEAASIDGKKIFSDTANIVNFLIEKCDPQPLATGFSNKITSNNEDNGITGWYLLMHALAVVSYKDAKENIKVIIDIINKLSEKCDAKLLAAGLFEQTTQGRSAGKNAWHFLMSALDYAFNKGSKDNIEAISNLIIRIIARLDSNQVTADQKQRIFSDKIKLYEPLKVYLEDKAQTMPIEEFKEMCGSNKLLGALIDHHRSFGGGKTTTRKFVEQLISQKQTKAVSETASHNIISEMNKLKTGTQEDAQRSYVGPASSVLSDTQTSTELPPPSYEQALQIIIAEKRRAKISVLKAAEVLFEKLLTKLPCDTELRALDTAKSEAKKVGYDFEADEDVRVREIRENIRQKIGRLKTSVVPQHAASPAVSFFAPNATTQQVRHRSPEQIEEAQRQEERVKILEQVRDPSSSKIKQRKPTPEEIRLEETVRLLEQVRVPTSPPEKREELGAKEASSNDKEIKEKIKQKPTNA